MKFSLHMNHRPGISPIQLYGSWFNLSKALTDTDKLLLASVSGRYQSSHRLCSGSTIDNLIVDVDLTSKDAVEARVEAELFETLDKGRSLVLTSAPKIQNAEGISSLARELSALMAEFESSKNQSIAVCVTVKISALAKIIVRLRSLPYVLSGDVSIALPGKGHDVPLVFGKKLTREQVAPVQAIDDRRREGIFGLSVVVLDRDKPWQLMSNGTAVVGHILDKEWLLRLHGREVSLRSGDALRAKFSTESDSITGKKTYYIHKILDHREAELLFQESLDFGAKPED